MFGSNFIELGIAVAFLFLLLALMCSLLSETLSKYFSWRAEMLEESIHQLLRDSEIAEQVYKHPVIKSLGRQERPVDKKRRLDALAARWPRSPFAWANRKLDLSVKPAYIKSSLFARVTLDVIVLMPRLSALSALQKGIANCRTFDNEANRQRLLLDIKDAEFDTAQGFEPKITAIGKFIDAYVTKAEDKASLLELVDKAKAERGPLPAEPAAEASASQPSEPKAVTLPEVRAALGRLKNGETRRILEALVVGDDIRDMAQVQLLVARYYDDIQERVSGWYKRKSQRWVFSIGLGLAFILNADTLVIANKLLRDNSVRAVVVAAAERSAERYRPVAEPLPAPTTGGAGSTSSSSRSGAETPASGYSTDPGAAAAPPTLQELKQEIEKLSLPMGWPQRPPPVASSLLPTTLTYAEQIRRACADEVSTKAAGAKEMEATALAKLNQAKAQLEEARQKVEDLKKQKPAPGEDSDKHAEKVRAATAAADALTKEIEAATSAVEAAKTGVMSVGDRMSQLKSELESGRREAEAARVAAEKRRAEFEKARAEVESDPRACPEYLCGDRTWGEQWPYYTKSSVLWVLTRAIGWLITALAAALGAQFWFDVLSKIMQVRTSKKPDDQGGAPAVAPPSPSSSSSPR
jgi:hypothetical protein